MASSLPSKALTAGLLLSAVDGEPVIGHTDGAARVFRFAEEGWRETSEGLPRSLADGVCERHRHNDDRLYAGVMSIAGPGLVYRRNGEHWAPVGGGVQLSGNMTGTAASARSAAAVLGRRTARG